MKKLVFENFTFNILGYYSYTNGDIEITVEPCLNGADVAAYKNEELLESKKCTNLNPINSKEYDEKVLEFANYFYEKYVLKGGDDNE